MKTELIQIRISESLKSKAKSAAESDEKSLSEYILDLIKSDLTKREA